MLQCLDDTAPRWQALRQNVTQAALWFDLASGYARDGLLWQAGYTARQALRLDASLWARLQALQMGAWQDAAAGDAALGNATLAQAASLAHEFEARYVQYPGDWLTCLYLARLQEMQNVASNALARAGLLEPMAGESLHWMGVWRLNAGDAAGAVAALSGLLQIRPVRFGSMMYLGEALLCVGNTAAAEKAFGRAALSNNPDFLQALAARVYAQNYWQEAIQVLEKALDLRPNSVPIMLAQAKIFSEVYLLEDCRETLRQVLLLAPEEQEAQLLLAGLQGRMGDAKEHLLILLKAYENGADPLSRLASGIAMTLLYQDDLTAPEVADWHRRLCAPIEAAFTPRFDFPNSRNLRRRLKIAYVSGDFHRQHPVNVFMLPVLQRHTHVDVEIFVYHTGTMHDHYTQQAKECVDHWQECARLDDAALQRLIVADGIDILIDLGGHTSTHRLGVFAMRAAPVQATFLGYPHSTGLSTIDWLIGDATVSPAEQAHLFSEGVAQLPGSVFCWAPVDVYALPPPRPPDAPVVFGSFNNAMKLSPKTIALWARVLLAVPGSLLLLKAPSLRDPTVQARFSALFAAQGVDPARLILRGPTGLAEMMQEYGDMDIALDPTPYNGGTTTLQALWMGVPVVVLAGHNFVGRMGASFMKTLAQPDWVAGDDDAYVDAAARLAESCQLLRGSRASLRQKMADSKLCNIGLYVSQFEDLLRRMWITYCVDGRQRVLLASPTLSISKSTITQSFL